MKVEIQSKKGLRTILSVIVDKKTIQNKLNERLNELQKEVTLKGFRTGKVPTSVIKNQYGKSIYGEVIDKILRETSSKAIEEKKIKIAGQPKIDLKTFGEGKDLNFELQLDLLPEIKLQSFEKFKATNYLIKVEKKDLDQRLNDLTNEYKSFEDKGDGIKSELGDQIIFNYKATVDGKDFEGGKGEGVILELGKDLFLKGFDNQLLNLKKKEKKKVKSNLPPNHPKKELANKETIFECEIINIKSPKKSKLNDEFAKKLGAKNLTDLTEKLKNQIINQYNVALNSMLKKEILDQIEKLYKVDIPKNLLENELKSIPNNSNSNKNNSYDAILVGAGIMSGTLALLITEILMFIGGAPASVAGGIKITTFVVLALAVFFSVKLSSPKGLNGKNEFKSSLIPNFFAYNFIFFIVTNNANRAVIKFLDFSIPKRMGLGP